MAEYTATLRAEKLVVDGLERHQHLELSAGSEGWFQWLQSARSFIFDDLSGHFTARKKTRQGANYWYAVRRYGGRLREVYLGKAQDITIGKLREAAARLNETASRATRGRRPTPKSLPREPAVLAGSAGTNTIAKDTSAWNVRGPQVRTSAIMRTRIMDQLRQMVSFPLTVVDAPAGYGKTTLLANFISSAGLNAIWVTLTPDDNDAYQFWEHIGAALSTALSGFAPSHIERLEQPVQAGRPRGGDVEFVELLSALAGVASPILLILDEYEHLHDDNVAIHASVTQLLELLPANVHLVLVGRAIPHLPLAKLRMRHQLLEFRMADLQFSREETKRFFVQIAQRTLTDEQVNDLWTQTEGWVTGLELAAHSLQQHADSTEWIDEFSGQNRFVFDYFAEEILDRLPSQVLTFVLHLAVLSQFNAPLCDAVSRSHDSRAMLRQLERANLFLVRLDDRRDWFRFHPLFAEVLLQNLRQREPELEPTLNGRASRWCESSGMLLAAIDYAFAANEPVRAARLLEVLIPEALAADQWVTVLSRLSQLPEDLIQGRVRLAAAHSYTLLMSGGDRVLARRRVQEAERALVQVRPRDVTTRDSQLNHNNAVLRGEVLALSATFRFLLGRESVAALIATHRQALAALPRRNWLRCFTSFFIGLEELAQGLVREASHGLEILLRECEALGRSAWVEIVFLYHGLALLQEGRLDDALDRSARVERYLAGNESDDVTSRINLIRGKVSLERNNLDSALDLLHRALSPQGALSPQHDSVPFFIEGCPALAYVYLATGSEDVARQVIEQGLAAWKALLAKRMAIWAWTGRELRANQARLWLLEGEVGLASKWARTVETFHARAAARSMHPPVRVREIEEMVIARTYLAEHRPGDALALLERIGEAAAAAGRRSPELEMLILKALAHDATGNESAALLALRRAVRLATPQKFVRAFIDGGSAVRQLLIHLRAGILQHSSLPRLGVAQARHLGHILAAFAPRERNRELASYRRSAAALATGTMGTGNTSTPPPTALTPRQLQILRLIAAGATNQQIADDLVVAIATVKRHVSNIYLTLNVRNRTQAVDLARQLGLPIYELGNL